MRDAQHFVREHASSKVGLRPHPGVAGYIPWKHSACCGAPPRSERRRSRNCTAVANDPLALECTHADEPFVPRIAFANNSFQTWLRILSSNKNCVHFICAPCISSSRVGRRVRSTASGTRSSNECATSATSPSRIFCPPPRQVASMETCPGCGRLVRPPPEMSSGLRGQDEARCGLCATRARCYHIPCRNSHCNYVAQDAILLLGYC